MVFQNLDLHPTDTIEVSMSLTWLWDIELFKYLIAHVAYLGTLSFLHKENLLLIAAL